MSQVNLRTVKLGNNADTSKNFLITVPAVADGTLTITRENGTPIASIAANGQVAIPNLNAQTIQNVTGSRLVNTDYTNNTALPITVMVCVSSTAAFTLRFIINGITGVVGVQGTVGFGIYGITIVPPGGVYRFTTDAGTPTVASWVELR